MANQEPTEAISAAHAELTTQLPFDDDADFAAVQKGFLGTLRDPKIRNAAGDVVWDATTYDFIDGEASTSVNPESVAAESARGQAWPVRGGPGAVPDPWSGLVGDVVHRG